MAEVAEERDKENFLSGRSDGRNVSEEDRESPATREATEKKIPRRQAAAGPVVGRFQRNTESPPQHPQHRAFLSGKMPVAARALLGLAGAVFFSGGRAFKRKTSQLRNRPEEFFRARLRPLTVRTALPCRYSPDSRQIVISSAKELFFDFYFPRCSEVPAME